MHLVTTVSITLSDANIFITFTKIVCYLTIMDITLQKRYRSMALNVFIHNWYTFNFIFLQYRNKFYNNGDIKC
jgi:hypothetical protein